jgi:hypothetical protein
MKSIFPFTWIKRHATLFFLSTNLSVYFKEVGNDNFRFSSPQTLFLLAETGTKWRLNDRDLQHPTENSSEKTYGPSRYRKLKNGGHNRYRHKNGEGDDLIYTCLVFQSLTSKEGRTVFCIELYFFLFTVPRTVVSWSWHKISKWAYVSSLKIYYQQV